MPAERDRQLVTFIADHIDTHGYAPTYREMAEHLDVAIKSVRDALDRLRGAGVVTWQEGRTRTLRIQQPTS